MFDIFLVDGFSENVKVPYASGSASISGSGTTVTLGGLPVTYPIQVGDFVSYLGQEYTILSWSFYSTIANNVKINTAENILPVNDFDDVFTLSRNQLVTGSAYVKLDCENIDLETVFSIADIADISSRKDAVTKNIKLKGTDKNNKAFGHLFFLNKDSDLTVPNKLFFNYNPLKAVDCLVYENNILILRGKMIVTDMEVDENGLVNYNTTVTGELIGLKNSLADKSLADINFSDLQHQYWSLPIINSWGGQTSNAYSWGNSTTQRWNGVSYYTQSFEWGSGYVYPYIDYGEKFNSIEFNTSYNLLPFHNFRPAIWVKEYMNRIFSGSGYTLELRGDDDFIERFNSLIIPDNQLNLESRLTTNRAIYSASSGQNEEDGPEIFHYTFKDIVYPIRWIYQANTVLTDYSFPYGDSEGGLIRDKNLLIAKRNFKSDARVKVNFTYKPWYSDGETVKIQMVKRAFSTENGDSGEEYMQFDVLGEQQFELLNSSSVNLSADFIVPEYSFNTSDQLQVRLVQNYLSKIDTGIHIPATFTINSASLEISKDANTAYSIEPIYNDIIVPKAPDNIKQMEFVKGIISLFNLYVYTEAKRPKHFIFEDYNRFYSKCLIPNLPSNAMDWTQKVDYSGKIKIKSNINLAKQYAFTYKEDSDFLNSEYKKRTSEIYGQMIVQDSLGTSTETKVETVFSPSQQVQIGGLSRYYPQYVAGGTSIESKQRFKGNIRILYYNGIQATQPYSVAYNVYTATTGSNVSGSWGIEYAGFDWNYYPMTSPYYFNDYSRTANSPYDSGGNPSIPIPETSLYFENPKEFYFNVSSSYNNLPTLFDLHYDRQIQDLTNPNNFTVEVDVRLNEGDINTMDLRVPVYIDMGELGTAYFRILEINYRNSDTTATVKLKKISP